MKKKLNIVDEISIDMMDEECKDAFILKQIKSVKDINMKGNADSRTLLNHAVLYERHKIVRDLLKKGADVSIADDTGDTPLHSAVGVRDYNLVKQLISHGAPVNVQNIYGNTPLIDACQLDLKIIKLLLEHGADPTIKNLAGVDAFTCFEAYPEILALFKEPW